MPLIALEIPPGIRRNGTDLQQAGSWNDANLVRWYEGSMQPVGGWRKRTATAVSGLCRALLTWDDNNANRHTAAGTHTKLYHISQDNVIADITPSGFVAGSANATGNSGWSRGTWGSYAFGVAGPDDGAVTPATTWSLDAWGQYMVGCATSDGKIYQWILDVANVATVLSNAPTDNTAIAVTEERFLFALGAGGVGNKVQWSDQEDNNLWAAAATNQAGSFTLQTPGNLICARPVRGQTLLLTNVDAHSATYTGPPYVYSFAQVGTGCGVISANAVAVVDDFAVWMSNESFFIYDGSVRPLESTVGDFVFANMTRDQRSKVAAVRMSAFQEVWWFYPSATTENNKYVIWNYKENHWSIGEIARTAGQDTGVFVYPNIVGADGFIYEHEVGFEYDDATIYAETGPIEIGTGDRLMVARSLIPDEKTQGDVTATFKTRNFPNATESSHGPFTMANPTSVRFQGRQLSMRVTGSRATDWRVGTMRLDAVAGSRR